MFSYSARTTKLTPARLALTSTYSPAHAPLHLWELSRKGERRQRQLLTRWSKARTFKLELCASRYKHDRHHSRDRTRHGTPRLSQPDYRRRVTLEDTRLYNGVDGYRDTCTDPSGGKTKRIECEEHCRTS